MFKMKNQVQQYAWGSYSFIQELLNDPNLMGKPVAELWMGAHPSAPSELIMDVSNEKTDTNIPLNKYIAHQPKAAMGKLYQRYRRKLPFLLKVLAAEKALSIQAHPNKYQASVGYRFEQSAKIPISSALRNYKDDNHKPELLCALTEFVAMAGFRKYKDIVMLFRAFCIDSFFSSFTDFALDPHNVSFRRLLHEILEADTIKKNKIIDRLSFECDQQDIFAENDSDIIKQSRYWVNNLLSEFHNDIGVIFPLLLNIITLRPFEAIFISAGIMHAYLSGSGIEIMANSDNVLRGGLTPKHIDVFELMSTISFKPHKPKIIKAKKCAGFYNFQTVIEDFKLSYVKLSGKDDYELCFANSQILFCYSGTAEIKRGENTMIISKGESVFLNAEDMKVVITGCGILFIASFGQ